MFKKMKDLVYFSMIIGMMTLFIMQPIYVEAADSLDITGESAIVVDSETGKILYSKNPDMALPPASMTKMMTEYLVLEAIENGDITWDTKTQISDYAYSISADTTFSGIGLSQNKDYTVKSLYEAMAINSDNATSIALAELIAETEGEFVNLMNEKGEEMDLPDFRFVNSTGLENNSLGENYPEGTDPEGINLLSARSSALLAYHLIHDHPNALEISSIPEIEFDDQIVTNWNWMLPHEGDNFKQYYYEGIDGLKTGNTDLAGYCFTGTAERNGNRLITVIMKTDSEDIRFAETAEMLDYGYENFKTEEIFPDGFQLTDQKTLDLTKGKSKTVNVAMDGAFNLPIKEGQEENFQIEYEIDEKLLNDDGKLTAPIKKGDKVGKVKLINSDEADPGFILSGSNHDEHDLVATEDVEQSNWFMITLGSIGDFFIDLFTSIVNTVKGWF